MSELTVKEPVKDTKNFKKFLKWAKGFRKQYDKETLRQVLDIYKSNGLELSLNLDSCTKCKKPSVPYRYVYRSTIGPNRGMRCRQCACCKTCCGCFLCTKCGSKKAHDNKCKHCKNCTDCCSCVICNSCGTECSANACRQCAACDTCCRCLQPTTRGIHFGLGTELFFHEPSIKQVSKNKSKRFISAEIEVAGARKNINLINDVVYKWKGNIVQDASLNHTTGFEINTAPAGGDLFLDQINDICGVIKESKGVIDKQCGLHVHIDARDMKYFDIRRLIKYYSIIEPVLFGMVPASRRASKYCIPCGDQYVVNIERFGFEKKRFSFFKKKDAVKKRKTSSSAALKQSIIYSVYGNIPDKSFEKKRTDKYGTFRYNALNLHSWFFRGTIECRLFPGSVDAIEITNWGMMWACILDYVSKATDKDIEALEKHKRYDALLLSVQDRPDIFEFIKNRLGTCSGGTDVFNAKPPGEKQEKQDQKLCECFFCVSTNNNKNVIDIADLVKGLSSIGNESAGFNIDLIPNIREVLNQLSINNQ